ncbi:hypothetical protein GYMLUDRAFT_244705 [Collybiopsis luxurians FD-317 M1]|uniref:Uncharacterized protein n=1 Tax=Collybiopsis luxurians FD-317 M1 TaxID=944289 RepID=A0A0D0CVC1_9AGAR|nr:hypothetical protein GYMLUDRAFT_244705 [Collybiopsis luxurians FD-317 M1]
MASDSIPAFFIDWTKYPNMAFKYIMPSMTSALEPKLQPTRSGNAKIRVSKKFRTKIRYMWPQSKKDRSFEEAEWSSGMRKPQPTGGEIFGAEDDEDDEPAFDSNLVLLRQHMDNYIDSDEELDPNPKDPRSSKSSNPSSDKSNEPIPPHSQLYCTANKLPTIKLHYLPTIFSQLIQFSDITPNVAFSSQLFNIFSCCAHSDCVTLLNS